MPQRFEALSRWLRQVLETEELRITPASGDASFRRYFRVEGGGDSRIAMDAPPDKEDTAPFIAVSRLLHAAGLTVPQVLAADPQQGFLLLTDLGSQSYLQALTEQSVEALYGDAMAALLTMQARVSPASLPPYDESRLLAEMELFRHWYLEGQLGLSLSAARQRRLDEVFARLAASALGQPQVFVHRDYHSRNLMVLPAGNPGILDFQDAVRGPVTYDLVSLLRDCYIAWPRQRVEAWALGYRRDAREAGVVADCDEATWLRWFDWMGVQRHLKATGIFARLHLRDAKPGYLDDIPRTLAYVREVSGRYSELQALRALLDSLPDAA
jgi:aminoglycoside/choline kinase family phosphotransferase